MKEYKLVDFEVSDFKDDYGNTWCNATFEGFGEPVRWVVKDPSSIVMGKDYYGEMLEKTSQAGKAYQRFYKRERPDEQPHQGSKKPFTPQPKQTTDYEPGTNARWAIGMAYRAYVTVTGSPPEEDEKGMWTGIEDNARRLVNMFERLKNGGLREKELKEEPDESPTEPKAPATGYEKAKATAQAIKKDIPDWMQGLEEPENDG